MIIMAPADENECRQMLTTGFNYKGPATVRYPRGKGPGTTVSNDLLALEIGKAEICHQGSKIAILAWGSMVTPAVEAGKQLGATVVNMRFIKPIDEAMIAEVAKNHDVLVTIEENVIAGGAGSLVNNYLQAQRLLMPVLNLGLPDAFIEQGTREELLEMCGLETKSIIDRIKAFCA
jgi:1-deoxy-D-xylulose-5-phosphate synthase